jgi:Signal transduction histidine kinase
MAVAYDLDLTTLLQNVVDAAREMVGARYSAIGVLDPTGTHLADFITSGLDDEQIARIGELPKGHGILGLFISDPAAIRLPDLAEHPASYGFPLDHPRMTSFLGVPLYTRGEVFGNLYLTDKRGGDAFSDIDEELAQGLAAAVSPAIENVRLHERTAELGVLADRERIARDLHDTVLQELFATGLAMQRTARRAEDPNVADLLNQHIDDLDHTIREIRTVIFGFNVTRSPASSLQREIVDLVEGSVRALGFVPTVLFDGPVDSAVPGDVASELLPVLREALSNIARHAAAAHVDVRVITDNNLSLEVADDGRGFIVESGAGNGLRNMRYRATVLGGHADIGPGPNGGTTLRWVVPLAR